MRRLHQANTNTPERYKELYYGPRRPELRARPAAAAVLNIASRVYTLLDVGCGYGQYIPFMKAINIVGVDFSAEAIDEARHAYPDLEFLCKDFSQGFPFFHDHSFDTVFCSEVLEHMEQPQLLIDECQRVLRPSGTLILTTPYQDAIDVDEHLWTFNEDDLRHLLRNFTDVGLLRYSGEGDLWEHFIVLARKA